MSFSRLHEQVGQRRGMNRPEQALQRSVIDYCRYAFTYHGRALTEFLFHIFSGGKRSVIEASIYKALGVLPGVPDLCLPIAAGGYGGLWIELKVERRHLTDLQMAFHQRLRDGGQFVTTCRTLEETVAVIVKYMNGAPGPFEIRDATLAPAANVR